MLGIRHSDSDVFVCASQMDGVGFPVSERSSQGDIDLYCCELAAHTGSRAPQKLSIKGARETAA